MKKHFAGLMLLLGVLALPETGWTKCKFGIEEADHVETKLAALKSKAIQAINSKLGRREGEYYLLMIFSSMGKKVSFDQTTPLEIVFANEQSVSLLPEAADSSRRTFLGLALNNRKAETPFFVEQEDFQRFAANELTLVRMNYLHDGIAEVEEFEIGSRKSERFQEYAACVLEYEWG